MRRLVLLGVLLLAAALASAKAPNVVVLLADDEDFAEGKRDALPQLIGRGDGEGCEIVRRERPFGKPGLAGGAREHDRHARVDLARFAVRRDRDETQRPARSAVGGEVERPETTDRERAVVGRAEIIRHLQPAFGLPFVIAIERHDAATETRGVAEGRPFEDSLDARVGVTGGLVGRRPGGDEAPRQRLGAKDALLATDGEERRARRDVIPGRDVD